MKFLRNVRINPLTGEKDYFFPMEIKDPADRECARLEGLEIGIARVGYREFEAIFVPCKECSHDSKGRQIYMDTPSEIQCSRYHELMKDELNAQDSVKQDGRCPIPDGHGGIKRCPRRVPNPDRTLKPKTIPVKCEGCKYERFRQAHTTIALSCLDRESDDGTMECYEIPAPRTYYAGDRYLQLRREYIGFVRKREPELVPFAKLRTLEYTKSEAARMLGRATSTTGGWSKKLEKLEMEFLGNVTSVPFS